MMVLKQLQSCKIVQLEVNPQPVISSSSLLSIMCTESSRTSAIRANDASQIYLEFGVCLAKFSR